VNKKLNLSKIHIKTPQLILKQINIEQSNELLELYSNKKVQKYTDNELINDKNDIEKLIKSSTEKINKKKLIFLGIFFKNKLIGTIKTYDINLKHSFASLGILLNQEYWYKGIMKEALTYFLDYYFNKLKFNRIEAQTFVKNYPAIKLFEKLGFKNEGKLRQNFLISGKFEDSYMFSMLRNE